MPRRPITLPLLLVLAAFGAAPWPVLAQDGFADPTFSDDGIAIVGWGGGLDRAVASAVAALPGGSLLVGGDVEDDGADTDFGVVKLLPTGDVDLSWGLLGRRRVPIDAKTGGQDELWHIAPLADGSVLLAGKAEIPGDSENFLASPALAKLDAGGDLDTGFGTAGIVVVDLPWPTTDYDFGVAIHQPDGKVLFAGFCYQCPDNVGEARPVFLRVTTAGQPDPGFSGDGWLVPTTMLVSTMYPSRLALDAMGRILVLGSVGSFLGVARLTPSGEIDLTYGGGDGLALWSPPDGIGPPYALAVDPDTGAAYAAFRHTGGPLQGYAGVMRFTGSGAIDGTFGDLGIAEVAFQDAVTIEAMRVQTDGKLVGVGRITNPGPDQDHFLFRLLRNGDLDPTFHDNGARSVQFGQTPDGNEGARAMTLSGGRLVTVGPVVVDGIQRFGISRATSALLFQDGFERGSTGGWGGGS